MHRRDAFYQILKGQLLGMGSVPASTAFRGQTDQKYRKLCNRARSVLAQEVYTDPCSVAMTKSPRKTTCSGRIYFGSWFLGFDAQSLEPIAAVGTEV